jgi:hypothetical protein
VSDIRRRLEELEKKMDRLEWVARHATPCHCGHLSQTHSGMSPRFGEFGTSCTACLCNAYSPTVVEPKEANA